MPLNSWVSCCGDGQLVMEVLWCYILALESLQVKCSWSRGGQRSGFCRVQVFFAGGVFRGERCSEGSYFDWA